MADAGEDFMLEVGVVYDVGIGKFDRSQHRDDVRFARFELDSRAAAGLTWSKYGVDFVRAHYSAVGGSQVNAEEVARRVHSAIIADVDTIDTGEFTLTHFLSDFNSIGKAEEDIYFSEAVRSAILAFRNAVAAATEEVEDEEAVKAAIAEQPGSVLVMDSHRFGMMAVCQAANAAGSTINRLVFPDATGKWRVQIVEDNDPLPEKWVGKSAEEFKDMAGIDGFVFCRPDRSMAGNLTEYGAVQMAHRS
jgi:uncharacterized UPF0160 family protein